MRRRPRGARGLLPLLLLGAVLSCTTALELGERRYREGDRLAALEIWRGIPPDHFGHEAAKRRIAEVEEEFQRLVVRYRKRGAYYEKRGRLAESVLNYRLALKLQTDDQATLDHVQELVRGLARRRKEQSAAFRERFEEGDLAGAGRALRALRLLDPFSAELVSFERRMAAARDGRIEKLLAEGKRGFTSGRLRRAERAFRQILALDEENESARGYLSYIQKIRSKGWESGQAGLGDPPGLDASDAEIRAEGLFQRALAAEREGDAYAAIRYDLAALRTHRVHPRVRSHLARLRRRLEPELPELLRAGREHYQQEDLQAALDQWHKALLVEPGNAQAREYAARAERLLENLDRLRGEPANGDPHR